MCVINDVRVVWQNDNFIIYEPQTFEQIELFKNNTKWCIYESETTWNQWVSSHKHIYVIVNKRIGDYDTGVKYYAVLDRNYVADKNELEVTDFFTVNKDVFEAFEIEKWNILYSSDLVVVKQSKLDEAAKIFVVFKNVGGKELVYMAGNRGMSFVLKSYVKEHLDIIQPIREYFNAELLVELEG